MLVSAVYDLVWSSGCSAMQSRCHRSSGSRETVVAMARAGNLLSTRYFCPSARLSRLLPFLLDLPIHHTSSRPIHPSKPSLRLTAVDAEAVSRQRQLQDHSPVDFGDPFRLASNRLHLASNDLKMSNTTSQPVQPAVGQSKDAPAPKTVYQPMDPACTRLSRTLRASSRAEPPTPFLSLPLHFGLPSDPAPSRILLLPLDHADGARADPTYVAVYSQFFALLPPVSAIPLERLRNPPQKFPYPGASKPAPVAKVEQKNVEGVPAYIAYPSLEGVDRLPILVHIHGGGWT